MKSIRWRLGFGAGLIVALSACVTGQEAAKSSSPGGIQAKMTPLPLYRKLIEFIDSGNAPLTAGNIRQGSPGPLPGIDWENASVLSFEASFFNQRKDFYCELYVDQRSSSDVYDYYLNSAGVYQRKRSQAAVDTGGWLYLPETTGAPLGFRIQSRDGSGGAVVRPVTLKVEGGRSLVEQESAARKLDSLQEEFKLRNNDVAQQLQIVSLATNQSVGDVPNLPIPIANFKSKNNDDYFFEEPNVKKVGKNLVVGAIRYNPYRKQGDYSWRMRPATGGKWTIVVRPLDEGYLDIVLPPFLKGRYRPIVKINRIKLWKDGSLIFPMRATLVSQGEIVEADLLVLQPVTGKPRLLSWRLHYSYMAGTSSNGLSYEQMSKDAVAASLDHVWFPSGGKKVSSNYTRMSMETDFCFDVDGVNNSVIYLLGGQLWSIDLSDIRF